MLVLCLLLIPVAFAVSLVATGLLVRVGRRLGAHDGAGVAGQAKQAARRVPNIGGLAIFVAIVLPVLGGLLAVGPGWSAVEGLLPEAAAVHADGVRERTLLALGLVGSLLVLHVLGLVDDRRPLGPKLKLAVMLVPAVLIPWLTDTRLLTMLDGLAGGSWLSVAVSAVWLLAVMNAINFMDNMDGLAAGVTAVAGGLFLAAAAVAGQWFVAAMLALTIGACLGFLCFNFPRAKIFMGDGGSLVLGFVLGFLTIRTTYTGESPMGEPLAGGWYAVLMPVVVLAVPLYDMVSVTVLRLRQGRSPMVGDLQHLSHRLVKRGLSRPAAVMVIWGVTAITGISGVFLGALTPWQAVLVGVQTAALLAVLAGLEFASSPAGARHDSLEVGTSDGASRE